jgi:hypothetical protein
MQLNLQFPPTPDHAADHAALCVSAAREVSGVSLDYTIGSLEQVDGIIQQMRDDGVQVEEVAETLFAFGCYVGEVLVRNAGAAWCKEEETPMKGQGGLFLVLKLRSENYCNPIGKVFKRLRNGKEDSIPYFYSVFAAGGGVSAGPKPATSAPRKPSLLARIFRGS